MLALAVIIVPTLTAEDDVFKITAYCSCQKCCGKLPSDPAFGFMANGKKAEYGYVACNWLPFGTLVDIEGYGIFIVGDRGAKSLFGDKKNKIKHLDMYIPWHDGAKDFGVKYKKVTICGQEYIDDKHPVMLTAQHTFVRVKPMEDF